MNGVENKLCTKPQQMSLINKFRFKINKAILTYLLLFLAVIISYTVLLLNIQDYSLTKDWDYFNSLSYVVHSIIHHYNAVPIHDPWVLGGVDILSNPQSRVFSPMGIFDTFFIAPIANTISLVFLGYVGIIGCYKLLLNFNIKPPLAIAGAIIYINASWFSLHFTVGHIPYGSFQLIALCFYFILKLKESKYIFFLAVLMAFFLLDGAIYTFVFSLLLLAITLITGINGINILNIWKYFIKERKTLFTSLLTFTLLSSGKTIPLLFSHASRVPYTEVIQMQFDVMLLSFFDPFQFADKYDHLLPWGILFHEFGCYIGVVSTLIILWYLSRKNIFQQNYKLIIIGAFFLIIASGRARDINPWRVIQLIPLINNIHIQSRFLILFYLIFIILLSKALNYFYFTKNKSYFKYLITFLILESVLVTNYSYYHDYYIQKDLLPTQAFGKNISNTTINRTFCEVDKPDIYFLKDATTKKTYEPAAPNSRVRCIEDKNYINEIYLLTGSGTAKFLKFTPGEIEITHELSQASIIQLNTNYLAGWEVKNNTAIAYSEGGLLTLKPKKQKGKIELQYKPWYLSLILLLSSFGMLILLIMIYKIWKKKSQ